MTRRVAFLLPGPLETPTGGFVYDRHVIVGCRNAGLAPELLIAEGRYPEPEPETIEHAAHLVGTLSDGSVLVVDGLGLTGLAPALRAHADRLTVVALIHHPLADESGLSEAEQASWTARERDALALARTVIVTSHTTTHRVSDLLGVPMARIRTVLPGVAAAPDLSFRDAVRRDGLIRLLSVGTLIRRKGHDVLIAALAELRDLDWRLEIIGEPRDPGHAASLRGLIGMLGLSGRITLRGAVDQDTLDEAYRQADLFVLASRHEGFGIAYQEAVRWGLPVVGTTAGAIPEAVPEGAGRLLPPGDRDGLRDVLRGLIGSPDALTALGRGARSAAVGLRRWTDTQADFASHIRDIAEGGGQGG